MDMDDKELKADDCGADASSGNESGLSDIISPDPRTEVEASKTNRTARSTTKKLRKRREANPFREPTLILPVRHEFYHSEVYEERTVEYYLQWVYSTSSIDVQHPVQKEALLSKQRSIRAIGIVVSRRLMAIESTPAAYEEDHNGEDCRRSHTFDDSQRSKNERPSLRWFLGYRLDTWIWYSKGWKIRKQKDWLVEHPQQCRRDVVWLHPVQASLSSIAIEVEREIAQQSEQTENYAQEEVAQLSKEAGHDDSDRDSVQSLEFNNAIQDLERQVSSRTDFYSHPGVGIHSDTSSQSDSSSTGSSEPPPSPPSHLRRSKSLTNLRSTAQLSEPPPPLDPPRPQRFHSSLDVIGEDNEDESETSEPPTSPSSNPEPSISAQSTSTDAIPHRNDSAGDELATLHSHQTTKGTVSLSDTRCTKFQELLHSSAPAETSESTLRPAPQNGSPSTAAAQSGDEFGIVVTHSVSTGIKMRLERLARALQVNNAARDPTRLRRRSGRMDLSTDPTVAPLETQGVSGIRRSLSRRLSSRSRRSRRDGAE